MEENSHFYWFDRHWISDYFGTMYEFEHPLFKTLMWVLPLVLILRFAYIYFAAGKFSVARTKNNFQFDPTVILAIIPPLFFVLSLEFLLMALSGPQKTNEKVEKWTEGIDIMLVIDISESMQGLDFKPDRLEAAKRMATQFVDGREGDRIGVIEFKGEAFSRAPITSDYELLKSQIGEIGYDDIQAQGTAIGVGIATAVSRMRETETKSKVIILLSDGEQNVGNVEAETAAKLAHSFGIKIYTIGIGKKGQVPYKIKQQMRDMFSGKVFEQEREIMQENTFNEAEMKKIAELTDGLYFRATNNNSLKQIFEKINKLEKNEIKEDRYKSTKDFYEPYLIWSVVFLLAWLLTKSTFLTSALHD